LKTNLVTDETNGPQGRTPLLELVHPVGQGRLGHEDHVGAVDVLEMLHEAQQRNRLQSFAKTHFVGLMNGSHIRYDFNNNTMDTGTLALCSSYFLKFVYKIDVCKK